MSMEQFFTRQRASEGKKFPLTAPDGTKTEHWLLIRGVDSDEFQRAEHLARREALKVNEIESMEDKAVFQMETERKTIASLVADWSFDQPCTPDNVVKFFKEAPQIQEMVSLLSVRRSIFFAPTPQTSADGQSKS